MSYCDILLHLTDDKRSDVKTALAFALAGLTGGKVTALYTIPYANQFYYMGGHVPPAFLQQRLAEATDNAEMARKTFEAAVEQADVEAAWMQTEMMPLDALEAHGRHFDITVAGQPDPDVHPFALDSLGTDGLPAELALGLGRPVLVTPYIGRFRMALDSVVVAWNGSREATRAVHDAMPLLRRAKKVTVLAIGPDDEQLASVRTLAKHLERHKVNAVVETRMGDDIAPGEALLSSLSDLGADLLVMGAYGHSRLRETVLGGVTDTIIDSMTVPVLLSN